MAAKMRGIQQAIKRTQQIVGEITGEKAVSAIKAANYIIRTESASMTPVATSTLINSQYDTVEVNGTRITGKIGYSANYALYVHNAPGKLLGTNTPRTGRLKGKGNVWDPSGEPKFLLKAGENTRELVDQVIKKEMTLK